MKIFDNASKHHHTIIITRKECGPTIRSSHQNSQTVKEESAVQTKGTLEELQFHSRDWRIPQGNLSFSTFT